jgi:hypothetical protein
LEATRAWIREFVHDHPYAHGLADDVDRLLREKAGLAARLAEATTRAEEAEKEASAMAAISRTALALREHEETCSICDVEPCNSWKVLDERVRDAVSDFILAYRGSFAAVRSGGATPSEEPTG